MGILEKDVELYLFNKVRGLGGNAFKIISPGNNGFPDRLVCLPGNRMLLAEIKRPNNKPRPLQLRMIAFLRSLGIEVLVIDSKEQVNTVINILRKEIENDRDDAE